jgi:hypothetical protein
MIRERLAQQLQPGFLRFHFSLQMFLAIQGILPIPAPMLVAWRRRRACIPRATQILRSLRDI